MKTRYTVKNFRVFDKKGVTVEISPLTFLVGCNSSGKSSIVKSLMLLKSFFDQRIDKDHPVIGSVIDFSVKPNDSLGSFSNIVRSSSKDKTVAFAYDVHSEYINDDVRVTLTLQAGELGNAVVRGIQIDSKDGATIISAQGLNSVTGNLVTIKDAFKKYLIATRLRSRVKAMLPGPDIILGEKGQKQLENSIKDLVNDASRFCDEEYLDAVYESDQVRSCKLNDQAEKAVDKFIETGIITYFAIMDEMRDMSDPEDVRRYLKSHVKNNDLKEATLTAIDYICDDYRDRQMKDFLSYYRMWEDSELFSHRIVRSYAKVLCGRGWQTSLFSSLFSPFSANREDSVYCIRNGYELRAIGYDLVHDTLAHLSDNDPYSVIMEGENDYEPMSHTVHPLHYEVFVEYMNYFLTEVASRDITNGIDYISSSRIQVRRMYPMEDRTEFSNAVRKYFDTKTKFMTLNPPIRVQVENEDGHGVQVIEPYEFVPGSFMNKWLKVFKIGDHISLEMDKNGLGLLLKVYQTPADKKGVLLADMGYGITQLFSILLQIEEMIMSGLYNRFRGKVLTTSDSMSGAVSIVLGNYTDTPLDPRTVAIEEPEIHLHPRFQSLLAEMFYEAYSKYNIHFIIETHSEYLLRKVQTLISARALVPDEVSMIYVEDDEAVKKGSPKVRRIPVKEDGRLAAPFSPGFYDEADNLSLELFTNMGK